LCCAAEHDIRADGDGLTADGVSVGCTAAADFGVVGGRTNWVEGGSVGASEWKLEEIWDQ